MTAGPVRTLQEEFRLVAARHPDRVAVSDPHRSLTYAELDERSDQLGRFLREVGGPERIGMCMQRSVDLIVGLLGILKAGSAYVPLDPSYPRARLRYLLDDAELAFVVTDRVLAGTAADLSGVRTVPVDARPLRDDVLLPAALPADLAYLMYTSGSQGAPKGVMVEHRQVLSLFDAAHQKFTFGPDDVWTLFHSYAFDFSVWEIFGALLHGGRLVVVPLPVAQNPAELWRLITTEKVTVLNQTPTYFAELSTADRGWGRHLRYVIFGGEALRFANLRDWYGRYGPAGPRLVNMYGITETTVHVTARFLEPADVHDNRSLIGTALPHLRVHLLDDELHQVAAGQVGEVFVGGAGVARGYWRRPEQTAERFVADPFGTPGERLYRSGDLARVGADGQLEYRGRADDQVKVRGHRVELGEIEAELGHHPDVLAAAVGANVGGTRGTVLVAHVVPRTKSLDIDALRGYLNDRLPPHLVPHEIVQTTDLPMTPNGKLDRQALRNQPVQTLPRETPGHPLAVIQQVCARVLGTDRVDPDRSFLASGGDSIQAIQVVAGCRERGIDVGIVDLLRAPDIRTLASGLAVVPLSAGGDTNAAADAASFDGGGAPAAPVAFALLRPEDRALVPPDVVDAYPLTAMQLGMLYHTMDGDTQAYHSVSSAVVNAPLDVPRLRDCLRTLHARHPVMRTSFDLHTYTEPVQLVHDSVAERLEVGDLSGRPPRERWREEAQMLAREKAEKLDWGSAPLVRFRADTLGPAAFRLTWTEHHAILDGWSSSALFAELIRHYLDDSIGEGPDSPPLFREHVESETAALDDARHREFWSAYLRGASPRRLAATEHRDVRTVHSDRFAIGPADVRRLRDLARAAAVPVRAAMAAVHAATLAEVHGGADEAVIGHVMHGRSTRAGGDRSLGLFLNVVPLRVPVCGSWLRVAQAIADADADLHPYRRLPLSAIAQVAPRGAVLDNTFNYVDFHVLDELVARGAVEPDIDYDVATSFELVIEVVRPPDGSTLEVFFQFCADCWPAERRSATVEAFRRALHSLLADPDGPATGSAPGTAPAAGSAALPLTALHPPGAAGTAGDLTFAGAGENLASMIARRARALSDRVAVAAPTASLTYGELLERADLLAAALRARGVHRGSVVGVRVARTPDVVVALLGVLRAGAAVLPLDPDHPPVRAGGMLADARAALLITDSPDPAPQPAVPTVRLAELDHVRSAPSDRGGSAAGSDLAYVLYTSGSTGQPKGVALEHRQLVAFAHAWLGLLGIGPHDRVLAWASVSFDMAVSELLVPLLVGARIELVTDTESTSPGAVARRISASGVNLVQSTPSKIQLLLEAGWTGRATVLCGGEVLPARLVNELRSLGCTVWNGYGPTETTVYATLHRVCGEPADPVPIGRPLPGVEAVVADAQGVPVPDGQVGELWIGGIGVARGYLNDSELTRRRFHTAAGLRYYRTGDLVSVLPDGSLRFHGRTDHQVKLHGVRVELGEVEHVLTGHPDVAGAAVVIADPGSAPHLVAYVLARGDGVDAGRLREHAAQRLPRAMLPTRIHLVSGFPMLPSGKVDRHRLAEMAAGAGAGAAKPTGAGCSSAEPLAAEAPDVDGPDAGGVELPPGHWERTIAETWRTVLGLDRVGLSDNFFDLGGDSLQMMRTIGYFERRGLSVTVAELAAHQTVAELAALARTRAGAPRAQR